MSHLHDACMAVIRGAMEARGMTQADLARATGLTTKHVNQIFRGHALGSWDCIEAMATAVGVPLTLWLPTTPAHVAPQRPISAAKGKDRPTPTQGPTGRRQETSR